MKKALSKNAIALLIVLLITQTILIQPIHSVSRGTIEIGSNRVVALVKDGIPIPACSAALISSDIVVTAAHCVYKTKYIQDTSGLSITYPGSTVNASMNLRLLAVARVLPVPTFVGTTSVAYSYDVDDIAFLFLKDGVTGFNGIKVADSSVVDRIKRDEVEIKHYGYGIQKESPYSLDGNPYSVILRATNKPSAGKSPTAKDERVLYSKSSFPGFATCGGDSGGPGYASIDSEIYLVAVISGSAGCDSSTYLAHTFSTLVFPHLDFLQSEYEPFRAQKAADKAAADKAAADKAAADKAAADKAAADKAAADKAAADKAAADKAAADKAAAKPVKKDKTVVCLKGKSSLKVIGKNPKCPAGYKVKK